MSLESIIAALRQMGKTETIYGILNEYLKEKQK